MTHARATGSAKEGLSFSSREGKVWGAGARAGCLAEWTAATGEDRAGKQQGAACRSHPAVGQSSNLAQEVRTHFLQCDSCCPAAGASILGSVSWLQLSWSPEEACTVLKGEATCGVSRQGEGGHSWMGIGIF